jgi:hypothetical protein
MGMKITFNTNSFTVDLGGLSADRKKAIIHNSEIRSLVESTDTVSVELVFSNGEIQSFPYLVVDSIDGDTNIDSQDKLYNTMAAKLFS